MPTGHLVWQVAWCWLSPFRRQKRLTPSRLLPPLTKLWLNQCRSLLTPCALDSTTSRIREAHRPGALCDHSSRGIQGRDVTPFLLKRVNELTSGKSLRSSKWGWLYCCSRYPSASRVHVVWADMLSPSLFLPPMRARCMSRYRPGAQQCQVRCTCSGGALSAEFGQEDSGARRQDRIPICCCCC